VSRKNPTPEDWAANSLPFEKALSTIYLDYDFLYQHFFSRLFEDALHILTIKKPPDSINYDFMMMCIVLLGRTVFFNHDSELIAMNAAPAGKPDLYYVPSRILVTNPRFLKSVNLTPGEDCEVVYCTSLDPYYWGRGSGGMYGLISTTASLLADNYLSLNIAQKNLRLTNAFAADDLNTKQSLEACMEEAYEGRPFLVVQKSLVDKLETLPMHSDSSNQTLIQLLDVHKYILSEYYAAIGLQEAQQMKRERLITAEVEDGAELPLFNIQDMIQSVRSGIERVNAMFGTEMTVEVNPLILRNLYGDQSAGEPDAPELQEEPAEDPEDTQPETRAEDQTAETEAEPELAEEEPEPEAAAEVVADAAEVVADAAELIETAAEMLEGGAADEHSADPIPDD
jgi:hypothetical protein